MARPSKYEPDITPRLVVWWARDGLTEDEIAAKLGICRDTLFEWKKKYPELSDALKESKDAADGQVEMSLFKRAVGYEYEETKVIATKDGKAVKVEKTKKHVAPDVTAQIFWLKNRQRQKWCDVVKQEITGKDGGPIQTEQKTDLSNYTTDELMQIRTIHEAAEQRRSQQGTG
jgi:hypothetical protein